MPVFVRDFTGLCPEPCAGTLPDKSQRAWLNRKYFLPYFTNEMHSHSFVCGCFHERVAGPLPCLQCKGDNSINVKPQFLDTVQFDGYVKFYWCLGILRGAGQWTEVQCPSDSACSDDTLLPCDVHSWYDGIKIGWSYYARYWPKVRLEWHQWRICRRAVSAGSL